jgi:hypothetical protein
LGVAHCTLESGPERTLRLHKSHAYTKCEHGVLNDITTGNNGAYAAGPGWDACTGLGTPQGQNLLKALSTAPTVASRKMAAHV